jgi:hypothetical protein
MALTTRLELSRQALSGLQDKKGHRVAGIVGALEAVKHQCLQGAEPQQLEDSFGLAFRVADLEVLTCILRRIEHSQQTFLDGIPHGI